MYKLVLPKITLDNFILLLIFMSPASNIVVFRTGIIDIRVLQVLWAIAFGCLFIKRIPNIEGDKRVNKQDCLIFCLYIFAISMSCIFSTNTSRSLKELIQYIYLFIIMYILYIKMKDYNFLEKVVVIFVVANVFFVLICLLSYLAGRPLIPSITIFRDGFIAINDNIYKIQTLVESGEPINRISGIMGMGPISIANLILIQSIFVNYYINKSRKTLKFLGSLLLIANLVVVILTYSRAAIIIFTVFHIILFLGKNKFRNLAIIFLAVIASLVILSIYPDIFYRILESFNLQEGSSKYHFVFWIIALKTGWNNIFTGIGLGNIAFSLDNFKELFKSFGIYTANGVDVHNFMLQIWSEQGAIGLTFNMVLVFSPIINYFIARLYKQTNIKPLYKYTIIAYYATLLYSLTSNNFYIEIFWILMAMAYSLKVKLKRALIIDFSHKESIEKSIILK